MSDTNNSLLQQPSFEPGTQEQPLVPEGPVVAPGPSGTFVIAEPPSQQASTEPVSTVPYPQMTVETVPEEPLPEAPMSADPSQYAPQETVVIPSVEQPFTPQGLVPDQSTVYAPASGTPPVPPSRRGGPLRWIIMFFLLLLLVLGGFLGIRFGSQVITSSQPVTLTYWGLWETEDVMRSVIAKFEAENPNIKINYRKENYREYRQRLESAIDRGEGPDLFRFHATWIPMLRNQLEPVPETVLSPEQFKSDFYNVFVKDLLAGTTLWGIPYMIDGLGLYVNEELFSSAGVSVPKTYEELLQIVPRLTVKDSNNQIVTSAIALGTTNNIDHFSDILGLMIMQNGGRLTQPEGTAAEEALVFYRKFSTPSDPFYTWNELQDNAVSAFANGRVAMMIAPSWRVFDVQNLNKNLRFRVEPVPQLPGNNISWASYWVEGVSSKSTHKEQAFTFLRYITSQEAVTQLYAQAGTMRLFGPPYALKALGPSLESDPFVGAYIKQAANARSFPLASKTHDNGLNDRMIKYMEDAINAYTQGAAPSQVLDTMSKGFNQVLGQYGLVNSR